MIFKCVFCILFKIVLSQYYLKVPSEDDTNNIFPAVPDTNIYHKIIKGVSSTAVH